ncbi:winged helix DNA-binding domain-containing protein [Catellatospora sp. NPDC049111]|uniref:winged helix DNA-binding domain-containing protein n=1 Tax=Catellatospora sp. NPDC049111 TaxID=3155271 RepID=UPI0033CA537C
MTRPAEHEPLHRTRARAQLLAGGRRADTAADVVRRVFAIQAQDATAAALGVRARGRDLGAQAIRAAYEGDRSIVRNWFMRGTLHTIPAEDVRWVTRLLAPRVIGATRHRYRDLGLTDELIDRADNLVEEVLGAQGPLTRHELAERLTALGVDPTGQAPFHLIRHAALVGRVCHGPVRAGEQTYVLLDDWVPRSDEPMPTDDAAVAELARRYLAAYAPATLDDFVCWSGVAVTVARRAWQGLARSGAIVVDGDSALLARQEPADESATPDVRLLPAYDNYLTGYRTRRESVDAAHEARVWPGGGVIRATVLVDGRVAGTWSRGSGGRAVTVDLFEPLSEQVQAEVDREAAAVTGFLRPAG